MDRNDIVKITKMLNDEGKLIEAGWVGFDIMTIPETAGPVQRKEMRQAFFAGSLHLFSSIMSIMDDGEEPTYKDMKRLDMIHKELDEFRRALELKHGGIQGTA